MLGLYVTFTLAQIFAYTMCNVVVHTECRVMKLLATCVSFFICFRIAQFLVLCTERSSEKTMDIRMQGGQIKLYILTQLKLHVTCTKI